MPSSPSLLAILVCVGVASSFGASTVQAPAQEQQEADADATTELVITPPPGALVSYFRLDLPVPASEAGSETATANARQAAKGEPLGVARWMHVPRPAEGGEDLELEILLFEEKTRLRHFESTRFGHRKLVWREVRARSGRTILLEDDRVGFKGLDTTGGEVRRRRFEPDHPLLLLGLVEDVRRGRTYLGSFSLFQPTAGDFETMRLEMCVDEALGARARALVVRGLEGNERARFSFEGSELVGFSWAAGGPEARRISAREFHERVARNGPVTGGERVRRKLDPVDVRDASDRRPRVRPAPLVGPHAQDR